MEDTLSPDDIHKYLVYALARKDIKKAMLNDPIILYNAAILVQAIQRNKEFCDESWVFGQSDD